MTTATNTAAATVYTATYTVAAGDVNVMQDGAVYDPNGDLLGRIFNNPDNIEEFGYETAEHILHNNKNGIVESPAWFAANEEEGEGPVQAMCKALQALVSRGDRGTVGKGNPSARWVAAFAAVSRHGGATRADILRSIEAATGRPMRAHLVSNLMAALRRRHGVAIEYNRAEGTYAVAAA